MKMIDWTAIAADLDSQGWAVMPRLLTARQCDATASLYDKDEGFRSKIVMSRHGFGRGEYKYFSYPLPALVEELRTALYPELAPIANRWHAAMGMKVRFPEAHADFVKRCHKAGQTRPTPCYCNTARMILTACIKISMASMFSRCRWRSCSASRAKISKAASSC